MGLRSSRLINVSLDGCIESIIVSGRLVWVPAHQSLGAVGHTRLSNGDLLTGDSYGNVCVWRRGYNAVTKSLKKIHEGPVFAICVLKDGSLVTGGGKDSLLVHFDPNYKKLEETFLNENLGIRFCFKYYILWPRTTLPRTALTLD